MGSNPEEMPSRRAQRSRNQELELSAIEDRHQPTSTPRGQTRVSTDDLTRLVERAIVTNNTPKTAIKLPRYAGKTDVEIFLSQFKNISRVNRWTEEETLLRLQTTLEEEALECGQATEVEEIIDNLRARFGITPLQARERLISIRRTPKQSVHELAATIKKLMKIGHAEESEEFIQKASLETFYRALNHKPLRLHLYGRTIRTLSEAVKIAQEYIILEGGERATVTSIEREDKEKVNQEITDKETKQRMDKLEQLLVNQQELLRQLVTRQQTYPPAPPTIPNNRACYECGGPHYRRQCPNRRTHQPQHTPASNQQKQGNGPGPTQ